MKMQKISVIAILLILMNVSMILAVTGVKQTDTFYDAINLQPVNNVQEILYKCANSLCSSQGALVHDLNTGNSNSITFSYPYNPSSTASKPDYYSHFSFAECYLPKEYVEWAWGHDVSVQYDYNFDKAEKCHSPIDSFSIKNDNYVNEPVVIDVKANLEADAYSAFTDLQLNWFPAGYENYYSAETRVTLEIYDSNEEVVYTDYKDLNILMDTFENVQFTWTPTVEDEYKAIVKTKVTDCQCSSEFEQSALKIFSVWPERPQDEAYTIINDLTAAPQFAKEGELVTASFNKISNYANSNYNKVALPTKVKYEISDASGNLVYTKNLILEANPNTVDPKEFSFTWTPDKSGSYGIKITGSADCTSVCVGKKNPEDVSILNFYVNEKPSPTKYSVSFIVKDSQTSNAIEGAIVKFNGLAKNTNNLGLAVFEVQTGNYVWEVSKTDYKTVSGNVLVEGNKTISANLEKTQEPICCSNEDCGTSGLVGAAFCKSGHVFKNFIEYLCNNPGNLNSSCSSQSTEQLIQACDFGCEQGVCLQEPQECVVNLDCGIPHYEDKYCKSNNVVKDYIIPTCAGGNCTTLVETQLVDECDSDEDCSNGKCVKEDDDDDNGGSSGGFLRLFSDCEQIWECTGWTSCYDGMKSRSCEDVSYCEEESMNSQTEFAGCEDATGASGTLSYSYQEEGSISWLWILIGITLLLVIIIVVIGLLIR